MLEMASREAQLAENLIAKQRQSDVLLLEISELAAQLAATNHFDDDGFNSPIDWMRFNCHLTEKAAADRIAVGRWHRASQRACRRSRQVRSGLPIWRPWRARWSTSAGTPTFTGCLTWRAKWHRASSSMSASTTGTRWTPRPTARSSRTRRSPTTSR